MADRSTRAGDVREDVERGAGAAPGRDDGPIVRLRKRGIDDVGGRGGDAGRERAGGGGLDLEPKREAGALVQRQREPERACLRRQVSQQAQQPAHRREHVRRRGLLSGRGGLGPELGDLLRHRLFEQGAPLRAERARIQVQHRLAAGRRRRVGVGELAGERAGDLDVAFHHGQEQGPIVDRGPDRPAARQTARRLAAATALLEADLAEGEARPGGVLERNGHADAGRHAGRLYQPDRRDRTSGVETRHRGAWEREARGSGAARHGVEQELPEGSRQPELARQGVEIARDPGGGGDHQPEAELRSGEARRTERDRR